MPNPPNSELLSQLEQLLQFSAQLKAQVERLTRDNAALREQLEAADSEFERLMDIIDAEAEDLQQFASNWFKPSAVVSNTRANDNVGILINGNLVGWGSPGQKDPVSLQMQEIALEVNRQNAAKRVQARQRRK